LVGLGRKDEAGVIWRAIAPHVQELPRGALESFIAQAGHARLCAALADREHAAVVYQEIAPFTDLWVCGMADGPNDGPVRLNLARLAILMDDLDLAKEHAVAALGMAESSHSLPSVADAHLVLAEIASARFDLDGSGATDATTQAQLALDQARQLGLKPMADKAQALLTAHRPRRSQVLTGREEQIVALLAAGLSNRAIAQRLQLSERTVENHVSHVLTKTGHSSRSGVAAWYAGLG
jgi:DNA-binding CsgD family transcriptional regulator